MASSRDILGDPRYLLVERVGDGLVVQFGEAINAIEVKHHVFEGLTTQFSEPAGCVVAHLHHLMVLTSDLLSGLIHLHRFYQPREFILEGATPSTYEKLQVVGLTHIFTVHFRGDGINNPERLRDIARGASQHRSQR